MKENNSHNGRGDLGIFMSHKWQVWRPRKDDGKMMSEAEAQAYEAENHSRIGSNVFFIGGITNVPPKYFQRHVEFLMSRINNMRYGHGKNPALALMHTEGDLAKHEGYLRDYICYRIDQNAVEWSDLVVCEATVPSTGTGQELERAFQSGKPIIMMARAAVDGQRVEPLHYYGERVKKPGEEKPEVVDLDTLPSLGGISPMIRGNPNVVAVIIYESENQGLRDLTTVMEEFFHDTHLSTKRHTRLMEHRKMLRGLEERGSFQGVQVPDKMSWLLERRPKEALKILKGQVAKDYASWKVAEQLFEHEFALRHPEDVEHDLRDNREPQFRKLQLPNSKAIITEITSGEKQKPQEIALPGKEEFTHIRFTKYRPNHPPMLAERALRRGISRQTVDKLEQLAKDTVEKEKQAGETYSKRHKRTHTI